MTHNEDDWPVIGIDLGTTYSCAGIWRNGRVEIIPNDLGNRTTPSWVAFTETERLIGEAAENQCRMNPINTIFDAKRLIGRRFYDETVQKDMELWPFKVTCSHISGENEKPMVLVSYKGEEKQFSAEEISAMVLTKMKDIAETYIGSSVKNAVVTVPAYFNDSQRHATKVAGSIAGLNVLRIINEPTAAAIACSFEKKMSDNNNTCKKNVLVFDLGGGTFDVSLLCIENDKFEVKAVGGDTHLGGSDFTNRMVSHFAEKFNKLHHKDLSQSSKAIGRLREACEKAKRALSATAQTSVELDSLFDGIDFSSTISRACFDKINTDLFIKCINIVELCLREAHMEKSDIDDIFLVGGSSRILKVQELLKELFAGKELSRNINADEAVAYGAAVHAGILCGVTDDKDMVLVDVTPLSLGVKVGNGLMSVIIPKNTALPTKQERTYAAEHVKKKMYGDVGASSSVVMEIPLYEGERLQAEDNNFLGVIELSGSFPSDGPPSLITVCFEIDLNGILNVSAEDCSSGNKSEIKTVNRSRLTKIEIDKMIIEAEEYKAQDQKYGEMVKAKNKLEVYANDAFERVQNGGQKVTSKDKKVILEVAVPLLAWLDHNSDRVLEVSEYEEKEKELELICLPLYR